MKIKYIASFAVFLASVSGLEAQTGVMGYGSKAFSPAYAANPANIGDTRFVLQLPTNINADLNSFFKINDKLVKKNDSLYFDLRKMSEGLSDRNDLSADLSLDIFTLGFKIKKHGFLTLGSQMYSNLSLSFSDDFIKLVAEGNYGKQESKFDQENLYQSAFLASYVGYTHSMLNDRLKVGVKVKRYSGLSYLDINKFNFTVKTDSASYPAYALDIKGSFEAQAGGLASAIFDSTFVLSDVQSSAGTGIGSGYGADLGVVLKLNDKITLSASAINLGSLKWTDDFARQAKLTGTGSMTYSGFNRRIGTSSSDTSNVQDEFEKAFKLQSAKTTFSTALPTQYFLSGAYNINKKHQVSAMWRSIQRGDDMQSLLGVKYQYSPNSWLQLMAGATKRSNGDLTFGAGAVLSPGPFQFFFLTDNISGVQFDNTKQFQVSAGMTLALKNKKAKTLETSK